LSSIPVTVDGSPVKVIKKIPIDGSVELYARYGHSLLIANHRKNQIEVYDSTGILLKTIQSLPNEQFSGFRNNGDFIFITSSKRVIESDGDRFSLDSNVQFTPRGSIREFGRQWLLNEDSDAPFFLPRMPYSQSISVSNLAPILLVSDFSGPFVQIRSYAHSSGRLLHSFTPTVNANGANIPVQSLTDMISTCQTGTYVWHFGDYDPKFETKEASLLTIPPHLVKGSRKVLLFRTDYNTGRSDPICILQMDSKVEKDIGIPATRQMAGITRTKIAIVWKTAESRDEVVMIDAPE